MNVKRAIISGAMMWSVIFVAFVILNFIPAIRNSILMQGFIVGLLILPVATSGSSWYFKKEKSGKGINVALVMAGTAMVLDALITVPFIEIPYNGRGYIEFFISPLFWVLIAEIVTVIYFYWKIKIEPIAESGKLESTSI